MGTTSYIATSASTRTFHLLRGQNIAPTTKTAETFSDMVTTENTRFKLLRAHREGAGIESRSYYLPNDTCSTEYKGATSYAGDGAMTHRPTHLSAPSHAVLCKVSGVHGGEVGENLSSKGLVDLEDVDVVQREAGVVEHLPQNGNASSKAEPEIGITKDTNTSTATTAATAPTAPNATMPQQNNHENDNSNTVHTL